MEIEEDKMRGLSLNKISVMIIDDTLFVARLADYNHIVEDTVVEIINEHVSEGSQFLVWELPTLYKIKLNDVIKDGNEF